MADLRSVALVLVPLLLGFSTAQKWIQEGAELRGDDAQGQSYQGFSTTINAAGTIFASGAPNDNTAIGATWVFKKSDSGKWEQQGTKLVGSGNLGESQQGWSVALNGQGNILASGGCGDHDSTGAVWIFTQDSTGKWIQQGNKLVGNGAQGAAYQGYSVALSSAGDVLASGGQNDDNATGAVWIFVSTGGVWAQQGFKLVGTGFVGYPINQGQEVALSGNGNILAIGGWGDNNQAGAVWMFTRTGSTWTQEQDKLIVTNDTDTNFGFNVDISSSGDVLAISGPDDNKSQGAVWMWVRKTPGAGNWTMQQKLVGTGGTGGTQNMVQQGWSVGLSSSGGRVVWGGISDNDGAGALWVFDNPGGTSGQWTQQGTKIVSGDTSGLPITFGYSVDMNSDGSVLVSGAYNAGSNSVGGTWVFVFGDAPADSSGLSAGAKAGISITILIVFFGAIYLWFRFYKKQVSSDELLIPPEQTQQQQQNTASI